ncbi:hypothetical protein ALQ79_200207 [Pseudomonas amygdali pv. lachrymans]|nr:hypothetical protein ALQ79_200207 [Pseudomonas amygdali pv. lachrymans]
MRPIFSQVLGLEVYCAPKCHRVCDFTGSLSFSQFHKIHDVTADNSILRQISPLSI